MMGRLSRRDHSFSHEENSEKGKKGEKEKERFRERSGGLGMEGSSNLSRSSWELRHLLAIVCPY
jgi:hypothetical protein